MKVHGESLSPVPDPVWTNAMDPLQVVEDPLHLSIQDQELAIDSLHALSSVPTRKTQSEFQRIVINQNLPKEQRLLSATILADHIQKHSLVLENLEIVQLKTLWKSEKDPEIQTALPSIMGILQPNSSRVGTRLKTFLKKTDQPTSP